MKCFLVMVMEHLPKNISLFSLKYALGRTAFQRAALDAGLVDTGPLGVLRLEWRSQGVDDDALNAGERTVMEIPLGQMTVNWEGRQYLSTFVIPNMHFHASIAFALLRHQGVEIGKRDFLMA